MAITFEGREEADAKAAAATAKTTKTRTGGAKPRANVEAAKAEVNGDSIVFEYDGEQYVLPPALDWDVEVFEAGEDGKIVTAVRTLLGDKQWATYKSKKRTLGDTSELWSAALASLGATPGE